MTKLNLKSGLLFATRLALAAVFAVIFFGVFITPANATTSYPVGSNPTGVAFDNVTNSMWVTNMGSHTISKLDINTGTRTDYPVGDNPLGVAFDNVTNSVWVANQLSSTVSKVNINTGTRTDYPVDGSPAGAAFDNVTNSIWVANNSSNTVSKVNINTGTRTDYPVGTGPYGVAFDNVTNSVWVTNLNSGTVSKININTGARITYAVGNVPADVAMDNVTNSMWVTNAGSDTISKLDINTGTRTDYPVGDNPLGVAFDNVTNSVWVANAGSDTVSKINIYTGAKTDFPVGNSPIGVAFDNVTNSIWVANTWSHTVSKIAIEESINNPPTATLTVIKTVVNDNGGTKVVADFPLLITTGATVTAVTSGVATQVNTGTYTISETNAPGYAASFSGDCDANGNVTLAAGDVKSCTITNDDIFPFTPLYGSALNLNNISDVFGKIWGPGSNGIILGGGLNFSTQPGIGWAQQYGGIFVTSYSIQGAQSQYLTQTNPISVMVTGPTGSIIEVWDLENLTVVATNITNPGSPVTFTAQPNHRYGGFAWYADNSQKNIEIFARQTIITPPNNPPMISGPSLSQSSLSHPNGITESSSIPDSTVTFKGQVDDPDGGQVRLQVELRQLNEMPFSGADDGGILTSDPVSAGSVATITRPGLVAGQYRWRARAIDATDATSTWTEFGSVGNVDFEITALFEPTQYIQNAICPGLSPQVKHLVFITHGWNDSANGWVSDMATSIRNEIGNNPTWAVCTYDWHIDASKIDFPSDLVPLKLPALASQAYENAKDHGRGVGQSLASRGFESIHFIAHSAGSNLIQEAATWVRSNATPKPIIHLTFLDAYDPNGIDSEYGLNPEDVGAPFVGFTTNWWAENYVDTLGGSVLRNTNKFLPYVYSFNLTNLDIYRDDELEEDSDSCNPFQANILCPINDLVEYLRRVHAWPHIWYYQSTSSPRLGFPLSLEGGSGELPAFEFIRGQHCDVGSTCSSEKKSVRIQQEFDDPIDLQNAFANGKMESSPTGTVAIQAANSFVYETASPVWLKVSVPTTNDVNLLRFTYDFLSEQGAEGVISVLVNDELIDKIDERTSLPGPESVSIRFKKVLPGEHVITFQLNPFTYVHSSAEIKNIQLGFVENVEVIDILPPTTSAITSGTLWKNGWYLGTTTVAFAALDNGGGVGVEKTEYSLDGGTTWKPYATTSPVLITSEGTTTITYRSSDFFGNTEAPKMLSIKIVSVKWFLDDALLKLKSINTGNKDIDKATDAVEKDLAKIIADMSWLDRNRPSWPKGSSVLTKEADVAGDLGDILDKAGKKKNNISTSTQAMYRDAQSEIVQSSALLATLSFDKAKTLRARNTKEQKALDKAIARIQKMFDRAVAKETKSPDKAVKLYGAAWFASEKLLKAAGATTLRASDLGALYIAEDMRDLMD